MRRTFKNGVTVLTTTAKDMRPRARTGCTGITKNPHGGYYVRTSSTYLGSRATLEEAIELRAESVRQLEAGTFETWAEEIRRQQVVKHPGRKKK